MVRSATVSFLHCLLSSLTRMNLYLSCDSPICTVLLSGSSDSDGTPLYHIYTSSGLSRKTTFISRISPSAAHQPSYKFHSSKSSNIKEPTTYGGGIEEVAQVHWKAWSSSRIVYDGKTFDVKQFMPSSGFLWAYVNQLSPCFILEFTRSHLPSNRTFTGPDGHTYTWHSGSYVCSKCNNTSKLIHIEYH